MVISNRVGETKNLSRSAQIVVCAPARVLRHFCDDRIAGEEAGDDVAPKVVEWLRGRKGFGRSLAYCPLAVRTNLAVMLMMGTQPDGHRRTSPISLRCRRLSLQALGPAEI